MAVQALRKHVWLVLCLASLSLGAAVMTEAPLLVKVGRALILAGAMSLGLLECDARPGLARRLVWSLLTTLPVFFAVVLFWRAATLGYSDERELQSLLHASERVVFLPIIVGSFMRLPFWECQFWSSALVIGIIVSMWCHILSPDEVREIERAHNSGRDRT